MRRCIVMIVASLLLSLPILAQEEGDITPTASATLTPTPTYTLTATPTATAIVTPTWIATATDTPTATLTASPEVTVEMVASDTPQPSPTSEITAEVTAEVSIPASEQEATPEVTAEITEAVSAEVTAEVTAEITAEAIEALVIEATPEITEVVSGEATAEMTEITTSDITAEATELIEATAEVTAEATIEATAEATEPLETTPEVTAEATIEVTAEATEPVEATVEVTAEATEEIVTPDTAGSITPTATPGGIALRFVQGIARYQNREDTTGITLQVLSQDDVLLSVATTNSNSAYSIAAPEDQPYWIAADGPLHQYTHYWIEVGQTIPDFVLAGGDLNDDSCIDRHDLDLLLVNYDKEETPATDINGDGVTNLSDLAILTGNFNPDCEAQIASTSASTELAPTMTPAPAEMTQSVDAPPPADSEFLIEATEAVTEATEISVPPTITDTETEIVTEVATPPDAQPTEIPVINQETVTVQPEQTTEMISPEQTMEAEQP